MAILNDRIKERRQFCGLTLLEVAEKLKVKEATAQRYESGEIKNIKHETIVELANIFNCSPSYLMGWTNDPIDRPKAKDVVLNDIEMKLLQDFRSLDSVGQSLMLQNMEMAVAKYKKDNSISQAV